MTNLTAYDIYDAAIENAKMNDIAITAEYFEHYADGAMNHPITSQTAEKMLECHNAYIKDERTAHNLYHYAEKHLSEIEAYPTK